MSEPWRVKDHWRLKHWRARDWGSRRPGRLSKRRRVSERWRETGHWCLRTNDLLFLLLRGKEEVSYALLVIFPGPLNDAAR